MKKQLRTVSQVLVALILLISAVSFSGCTTFNDLFLGKEDTSVNWVMEEVKNAPSMNNLEKIRNIKKEASAIYRYADRAHAEKNKWYKFTAKEKPGKVYFAYKNARGKTFTWEVYRQK